MKRLELILSCILLYVIMTGCSDANISSQEEKIPTYNSEKEQYDFLNLSIGDSIDNILSKYEKKYFYEYGEKDGLISELIYNKVEKTETFKNRDFFMIMVTLIK